MSNINTVVIEGNLTKAAELSRWTNGTAYCKFCIACNESYKDDAGNWVDIPSFFDCMCKGPYAESMSKHLLKGRRITVAGRLKQNRWKDEAGNTKSAVFVKVDNISLAPGSFQPKAHNADAIQNPAPESYSDSEGAEFTDESIPF